METNQPKALAPSEAEKLNSLVESLLTESFAVHNHLGEATLDQLGQMLEEARERMEESGQALDPGHNSSYDKCLSLYCMILMELEFAGVTLPSVPLSNLRGSWETQGAPTPLIVAPEIDVPELSPVWESPTQETAPQIHEIENLMEPMIPVSVPSPLTEDETPTRISEVRATDASPLDGGDLEILQIMGNLSPKTEAPKEASTTTDSAWLENHIAKEFLLMADYFKSQRTTLPFSAERVEKLFAQSLSFAIEAECHHRVAPLLPHFWGVRENAIRALLDSNSRKFDLAPQLKKAMDQLAGDHPQWLFEGKFPYGTVLTALRYILATLQPEKFQPGFVETGVLALFFGQDGSLGGIEVKNYIGLTGLQNEELVEFCFRLSRMHKLRARALAALVVLDRDQLNKIEEDAKAVIRLWKKIRFEIEKGQPLKQVA